MPESVQRERLPFRAAGAGILWTVFAVCLVLVVTSFAKEAWGQSAEQPAASGETVEKGDDPKQPSQKESGGELSWEMPGRVSIYDLQFGPAVLKDSDWKFLGNSRTFNVGLFGERLTLMVRFSYTASKAEIPLKFVIRLPGSRQYEETVRLATRSGQYSYHFTIHRPEDFLGSGSVYLYYGFSIVDVLDFTIMPGS